MKRVDTVFRTNKGMRVEDAAFLGKKFVYSESTLSPLRDAGGNVFAVGVVYRDISERKKAEDALRASERKYATLVEGGNDGVVIIQDGVIKFANSKISNITGFDAEDASGKSFLDFVALEYRKTVLREYKRRLSGLKTPASYEIELISRVGTRVPAEVSGSIIEYEGRPADMVVIRDITERKKAEEVFKFLSKTAMEFVELPPEKDVYAFIAERLKEMLGEVVIAVSSIDVDKHMMYVRKVIGLNKQMEKIICKHLNRKNLAMSLDIRPLEKEIQTRRMGLQEFRSISTRAKRLPLKK